MFLLTSALTECLHLIPQAQYAFYRWQRSLVQNLQQQSYETGMNWNSQLIVFSHFTFADEQDLQMHLEHGGTWEEQVGWEEEEREQEERGGD